MKRERDERMLERDEKFHTFSHNRNYFNSCMDFLHKVAKKLSVNCFTSVLHSSRQQIQDRVVKKEKCFIHPSDRIEMSRLLKV